MNKQEDMTTIKIPIDTALVKEDIHHLMERIDEEIMKYQENEAREYVAELLNNLLQYVSTMTFLRLGNIEIWVKDKQLIDSLYYGIEGGVREEYKIVRWIWKDEPRESH